MNSLFLRSIRIFTCSLLILIPSTAFPALNDFNVYMRAFEECNAERQKYGEQLCPQLGSHIGAILVSKSDDNQAFFTNVYFCQGTGDYQWYFYTLGQCSLSKSAYQGPAPTYAAVTNPGSNSNQRPVCEKGSILNLHNQSVGENIELSGLHFNLHYDSASDSSRPANRMVELNAYFPSNVPLDQTPPRQVSTLDEYERVLNNQAFGYTNEIHYKYIVPSNYFTSMIFYEKANLQVRTNDTSEIPTRFQTSFTTTGSGLLVNYKPSVWGLGHWTLSIHHYYNPERKLINWGFGSSTPATLPIKNFSEVGDVFMGTNENGSEVYLFDNLGRHLETRTSLMGAPIYKFRYLPNNQLDAIIDRDGLVTSVLRDSSGNVTGIRSPFGITTLLTVNSAGKLASVTDATGSRHQFFYTNDGSGLLSQIVYPSSLQTSFEYDELGYFRRETKNNGAIQILELEYAYDIVMRSFAQIGGMLKNVISRPSYTGEKTDIRLNYQDVSSSVFSSTSETEDSGLIQSKITSGNDVRFGSLVRFPTAIDLNYPGVFYGAISKNSKFTQQVTYTSGTGPFEINELKRTESYIRSGGPRTFIRNEIFNGPARTLTSSMSAQSKQTLFFDEKERVTKIANSGSLDTNFTFNGFGQLESVSHGASQQSFVYDAKGFLSQSTDANGNTTSYERNENGKVTLKTLPNGDTVSFAYTNSGQLKEIRTPNNQTHRFNSSLIDQVVSYLAPGNTETIYERNSYGKLLSITKPSGAKTSFIYQGDSEYIEQIQTPEGTYYFNRLDAYGRPVEIISPDGIRTTIVWAAREIAQFAQYDGSLKIGEYVLFYAGTDLNLGYITIDGTANFHYSYDENERITQVGLVSYSYQLNNTPKSGTNPETASVTVTENGNWGSTRKITTYETEGESINGLNYNYRNTMSITFPNTGTYTSDSFSDRKHNIIRTVTSKPSALPTTDDYQYDSNNRLVAVSGRLNSSYIFPAGSNNNVATYTHAGKISRATYDEQDRLLKLRGSIERDFQYTPDGDLSEISNCLGQKKFEYDFFGHLKKVTLANGTVIQYKIDGLGRRVARLVNGQVTEYYIWQDQYRLGAVLNPQGKLLQYYVYGIHPRAPAYMVKSGVPYPIIANERGDIQYVTDGQGKIVQEIQYDEYGAVLFDSSVAASPTKTPFQPLGWVSGLMDRETGLVRFGARDYDPVVGRWTSKDPIGFNGGDTNLYNYTLKDPMNLIDPSGLWSITFGAFGGYGGSVTFGRSSNGRYFGTVRMGVGWGGGASFDPRGEPSAGPQCRVGMSFGQYAEASAHFGSFEGNYGMSSGYSQTSGPYNNPLGPSGGLTPSIGIGAGASAGVELGFW